MSDIDENKLDALTDGGWSFRKTIDYSVRDFKDGDTLDLKPDIAYVAKDDILSFTIQMEIPSEYNYRCAIDFSCGETATALTYPDSFVWTGDNLDANHKFVPVHDHRYHLDIWFDGLCIRANASGVIR